MIRLLEAAFMGSGDGLKHALSPKAPRLRAASLRLLTRQDAARIRRKVAARTNTFRSCR
jgi:hypothetical protein